jgi:hemerythrin-like domain-containing protein
MTSEHDEGRALMARMAEAIEDANRSEAGGIRPFCSAATACRLMRAHIDKENGVLFPMGTG